MNFKQIIRSTVSRIWFLVFIMLYINSVKIWALPENNKRLAKTHIRNVRHIYARYDIPVTNDGRFVDTESGIWLRGTNEGYIFGAGVWVGAIVDGSKQVTIGYNTANCQTEMVHQGVLCLFTRGRVCSHD